MSKIRYGVAILILCIVVAVFFCAVGYRKGRMEGYREGYRIGSAETAYAWGQELAKQQANGTANELLGENKI